MNTTKLKDALVELQQQRAILDSAIRNIQNVLTALNGTGNGSTAQAAPQPISVLGAGLILALRCEIEVCAGTRDVNQKSEGTPPHLG